MSRSCVVDVALVACSSPAVSMPVTPHVAPPAIAATARMRALSAKYTRDGAAVLFLRDAGADENHAISGR